MEDKRGAQVLVLRGARQLGNLFAQFKGAFAENCASQALAPQLDAAPRCWTHGKPRHEVDFLIRIANTVVPVEAKPGDNVQSPSLRYCRSKFPEETPPQTRLPLRNLAYENGILSIPLYLADHAVQLAGPFAE